MLELIVGILIGLSTGVHIGLYLQKIKELAKNIWDRDPEPAPQVVTPLKPGYADVTDLSSIVTPKTPEQIIREEQARVRDL